MSLAVLEELKRENDRLLEERRDLRRRFGSAARVWKIRQILVALSAILLYSIGLLMYGMTIDNGSRFSQIASRAFLDTWPLTSVLVSIVVALLAVPWDKVQSWGAARFRNGDDST
jgi:hypothetical protein